MANTRTCTYEISLLIFGKKMLALSIIIRILPEKDRKRDMFLN